MLSHAENERIAPTGPGTPMGNVFRRYWLPAFLSCELPENDGAPLRVKLLGEDLPPTQGVVVAKTSPIRTGRDFNGKTIGVPSLEGISRISMNAWLEANGGDLASVKFVEIPTATATAAVVRGTIDATVITEPTLSNALSDCRIVAAPLDVVAKQFIETAWFGSDDWIAKNPAPALKFALAMRDAQRWANTNPTLAAGIYEKYSGATPDSMKNVVHTRYGDILVPALIQPVLDVAFKYQRRRKPSPRKTLSALPSQASSANSALTGNLTPG